ncbi:MAG: hypothetical protein EXS46_01280 [Candidatus Taylorbacteria bacterium]|nr:hypothetical protein [Candidatus Taylorbacteria bacterium]
MLLFPHYMDKSFLRFRTAVEYIDSLSNLPLFDDYMSGTAKPHPEIFIKRMKYFLDLLGNPERGFKFIHITGTSGKGTVATMVHNGLVASGKTCGLFTSPYVVSPIEKIQINDLYISPDEFADIFEEIKPYIDRAYISGEFGQPSYFEIYLAMAFVYFKQKKCEWVVLEVGCGGRYDATNIIPAPVASAITCIDYDHTEVLGKTLKKITLDKAGIIKKGSKFFTAETRPSLRKIFREVCLNDGASFAEVSPKAGDDSNSVLAETLLRSIGVLDIFIKKGIESTKLPARFEIMERKPLVIIDGAHNRSKVAHTVELLKKQKYQKLILILAIAHDKDSKDTFSQIVPLADKIFLTRFLAMGRKPSPPVRLMKELKPYLKSGASVEIFLDSQDAYRKAQGLSTDDDCILVTGSFYLAGELRKRWFQEEVVARTRRSF